MSQPEPLNVVKVVVTERIGFFDHQVNDISTPKHGLGSGSERLPRSARVHL